MLPAITAAAGTASDAASNFLRVIDACGSSIALACPARIRICKSECLLNDCLLGITKHGLAPHVYKLTKARKHRMPENALACIRQRTAGAN